MARSRFAGGDQRYLRDEQYRDSSRLASRASLHAQYSTATTSWFDWVLPRVLLEPGCRVLDAGCGAGWIWAEATLGLPDGVHLTLSDLSPGMVAEAADRVRGLGPFASVTEAPGDLQELALASRSFDRVVANHMLYHLPDPGRGVAQLARVVSDDGLVVVATNGRRHMRELWEIRAAVFGIEPVDRTIDVFGADTGFPILRDHFAEVRWNRYDDELRCTGVDDLLAYICSTPPAETASDEQREELADRIGSAIDEGGGVMTITKDVGCFVCSAPVR